MRRILLISAPLFAVAWCCAAGRPAILFAQAPAAAPASPQTQTIDRIVARVENDVILDSEVRELAAYQQLVDGRSQSREDLLAALIEQWVVRSEAEEARFPAPLPAEIDAEVERIQKTFSSAQMFRERLAAVGLTAQGLRRLIAQQLYLERYLDYKFRPAIQIDDAAIAKYYEEEFAPALRNRGQAVPPLEDVRDRIREVLVQRGINESANSWFDETKSRLQTEILPEPAAESKK
jgi:hypothetical protein